MKFERIIRPFQTQDVTPPRRVPTAYQVDEENVKLVIGKTGSGKSMNGSESITITKYMDTKLKETRT